MPGGWAGLVLIPLLQAVAVGPWASSEAQFPYLLNHACLTDFFFGGVGKQGWLVLMNINVEVRGYFYSLLPLYSLGLS